MFVASERIGTPVSPFLTGLLVLGFIILSDVVILSWGFAILFAGILNIILPTLPTLLSITSLKSPFALTASIISCSFAATLPTLRTFILDFLVSSSKAFSRFVSSVIFATLTPTPSCSIDCIIFPYLGSFW